jgi:hypothetical protein
MDLMLIANTLEDELRRDFSLPLEPFVMEEAVSLVADHSVSISRPDSSRQGLPSRPCRVGRSKPTRGVHLRHVEFTALALTIFRSAGASGGCESGK